MNLRRYYFSLLLPFLCLSLIWFWAFFSLLLSTSLIWLGVFVYAFFFVRFLCSSSSRVAFLFSLSLLYLLLFAHTKCQWRQQQNNDDRTFFALFHVIPYRCTDYESNTLSSHSVGWCALSSSRLHLTVCIAILSLTSFSMSCCSCSFQIRSALSLSLSLSRHLSPHSAVLQSSCLSPLLI